MHERIPNLPPVTVTLRDGNVYTFPSDMNPDLVHQRINEILAGNLALKTPDDAVDHPSHYTTHPSGVECITVTEHMNFCRGNAIKYLWRAGEKGNELEDLRKARWYLDREIQRLEGQADDV